MQIPSLFRCTFILGLVFALTACSGQQTPIQNKAAAIESTASAIYERLDNAAFKAKMTAENTVLLDVRTPGETSRGTIPGALIIDYNSPGFQSKIAALDRDKTYLVYCQSGVRSKKTCQQMQSMGFGSLYELEGGYAGWQQ